MQFKTIFWGNSEFCLPTLEVLNQKTKLQQIFTGLDKPIGRNQKQIKIPEPKEFGLNHSIQVNQEQDLKTPLLEEEIRKIQPDLMIVLSYGKIIPKNIYELPKYGTINLHASLLPEYRGASPIQNSLLHGDLKTGVTIQRINDKLDEGNILLSETIEIQPNEKYPELRKRLSLITAQLLENYLNLLEKSILPPEQAQKGNTTYCKKILKEHGKILWTEETASQIFNKWRAFYEWPGIYTFYQGKMIKFIEIENIENGLGNLKPGSVIKADKEGLIIQAKKGTIKVLKLQPADKKAMDWISFLNGHRLKSGDLFE